MCTTGLGLGNALLGLVITPPTNDRSSLVLVPLNVFLASLNVGHVGGASNAGNAGNGNDWVSGDITQPNWLVVDLVDNFARVVAAASDTEKGVGKRGEKCERHVAYA